MANERRRDGDKVSVVIVDDHPMVRAAVTAICNDDPRVEVVGTVANGEAAVRECERLRPDVLLLDLMLPRKNGFDVAQELKTASPATKVLVLTARDEDEVLFRALAEGVHGFLSKHVDVERLADAVVTVGSGGRVITQSHEQRATSYLQRLLRDTDEAARVQASLSLREKEVLALIAQGLSTRQMSGRLSVSMRTIEAHIASLYKKLGVHNRTSAVARAARLGLIETP